MEYENSVQKLLSNKVHFHNRNKTHVSKYHKFQEQIEKRLEKKIENIQKRNNWLETQKRQNYIHEYDRLMGDLQSGII